MEEGGRELPPEVAFAVETLREPPIARPEPGAEPTADCCPLGNEANNPSELGSFTIPNILRNEEIAKKLVLVETKNIKPDSCKWIKLSM